MAAVDEIAVKLGVNTTELKTALAGAGTDLQKFKKDGETGDDEGFLGSLKKMQGGMALFRTALVGGGLVAAFKGVFDSAVSYAEKYTGAADENVSATLRLRDAQKDLQGIVGKVGVAFVGAMESVGLALGSIVYGADAAADAVNKMAEEAKKAFDAENVKKMTAATEKLTEARTAAALAIADENGKVAILAGEYMKLLSQQSVLQKGTLAYVEKTIEVETALGVLRKQEIDTIKKEGEAKKKNAEEAKTAAAEEKAKYDDINIRRALNVRDEAKLFELQRKNVDELTRYERLRLAELVKQKEAKIRQVEIEDLLKLKLTDGLTPAEAKRLDELLKQERALEKQQKQKEQLAAITKNEQLNAEQQITAEIKRQADAEADAAAKKAAASTYTFGRTGGGYEGQSTTALEGVLSRLERQQTADRIANGASGSLGLLSESFFGQEIAAVRSILDARAIAVNAVRTAGEDRARFTYGDAATDRAVSELAQENSRKQTTSLNNIEARLAASPLFATNR